MNIETRFKIVQKIGFLYVVSSAITVYGSILLILGAIDLSFPTFLPQLGWTGYIIPIVFSICASLLLQWPRLEYSSTLSSPDSEIKVQIGDLFDERGHLIIGINDVFDTQLGEIIKEQSIQGQFLNRIYKGNITQLDQDIEDALREKNLIGTEDQHKTIGKNRRHPIGTTITLGQMNVRYFLVAYGYMKADLVCTANSDSLVESLDCLWDEVRRKGQGQPISIPIIGSDLARTQFSRVQLIKMIIISFVIASKKQFVSRQLRIIIHPSDIESVNLYQIRDYLKAVCF